MINQENNDQYDLNEALKVENLTLNDYEEICKRLKRKPNRTELGMFGVMSRGLGDVYKRQGFSNFK